MKTLIVSATELEVQPAMQQLQGVEFLVTGPGMVNTAYKMGKHLAANQYDLVINGGICGSFDRKYDIGTVFNITQDTFADLGADDNGTFIDIFGLGLMDKNAFPFEDGWLVNNTPSPLNIEGVSSITLNTVTGTQARLEFLQQQYKPVAESMEGAAFAYVCALEKLNYLQIRSVSNYVEPRNRENWNIPLAVKNLNDYLVALLK